ncbi:MAG: cell wall hydrolase [Rhodobacteraceae bacterium]|nr:cell wall hydrolase [Paracoccaceae bacterium]
MMLRSNITILLLAVLTACTQVSPMEATLSSSGYTSADLDCLSEALYFEARGTSYEGERAVGEVILNRAADSRFPASVCGVIDQRYNGSCQFSYRCDAIPNDHFGEPAELAKMRNISLELLIDRNEDITNGALFFHAASMRPGWFATLSKRGRFGGNIFYR